MITYEWGLPNGAKILLERDPVPLHGYERTFQLKYVDGIIEAILDYNFDAVDCFEKRMPVTSLVENKIDFSDMELLYKIVDEANALVALGRNG